MKHPLLALAFLLLATLGYSQANVNRSRAVTVRGLATEDIDPERVELYITYRVSDNVKDAHKAREQEEKLLETLQKLNISRENLSVDNLTAYGYGGSKSYNTNLALTKVYRLIIDRPAVLNELIPRLVQSGADNINVGKLESSQLEAKKQEVLAKAVENARQRAQTVARQANVQLGQLLTLEEIVPGLLTLRADDDSYSRKSRLRELQQAGDSGSESLNLRKIRISCAVEAVYELK